MPYIDQKSRKNIDREINQLIEKLKSLPMEKIDGNLNYCFCRILKGIYSPSYFNYNRMMGVLACVQQEIYRRLVAPYEDQKRKKNGEVF